MAGLALVARAVGAVTAVGEASEVAATVDALVRRLEEAETASRLSEMSRALRLARAALEGAAAERDRERERRFKEAAEAATLRREFETEVAEAARELDDKKGCVVPFCSAVPVSVACVLTCPLSWGAG